MDKITLEKLVAMMQKTQEPEGAGSNSNPNSPSLGPIPTASEPDKLLKPSNRCSFSDCKRKLMLTDITCKCNVRFCMTHRMPEVHNCSYDFKSAGRGLIEKANPKVDGNKIERI